MSQGSLKPVEGRGCGECAACCVNLSIADPELHKPADVPCPNLIGSSGCRIYDARPSACRTFYCAWRLLPELGDGWRPDRCGILTRLSRTSNGDEIYFKLIGAHDVIDNPSLALVASGMIAAGVRAHLVIQGAPATEPVTVPLNEALAGAVAARDMAGVSRALRRALRAAVSALQARGPSPEETSRSA